MAWCSNRLVLHAAALLCGAAMVMSQALDEEIQERRVNIPPIIVKQPPQHMAFRIGESIKLPCEATGGPTIIYRWLMNDEDFQPSGNDGRIAIQPGVGTLIFARPIARDEAIYQCIAETIVGVAVSVKIDLRLAVLEPFPATSVRTHRPSLGQSLSLRCIPPKCYPKGDTFWATARQGEAFNPVDLTDRITQDPDGNLHFANIQSVDWQMGRKYVCIVQNEVMRLTQHGSYQEVIPHGDVIQSYEPVLLYSHPTHQVALKGEVWKVKCIFSGNPTPRVTWARQGADMPTRMREDSFGQELVIENIDFADAGKYECEGINEISQVPIRRSFSLSVESAPFWVKMPESIDGAEGDKAIFHCEAIGSPIPHIKWYLNGLPLSTEAADPRRVVEQTQMTFFNLSKSDAMVVQCNATNKHGYIFANAYLNVLSEPAFIQEPPIEGQKAAEGQNVMLRCTVFGSPKPIVVWRKGREQLTGGRFKVQENGHLLIQDVSLVDAGSYTCTAINKFATVAATGSLIVRRQTEIRTPPLDVMVYRDTEAKFTCTATTDPEEVDNLYIEWKKDGELIDYRSAQRIFKNDMDNSLTISGTYYKDTGQYTCMATNGLDSGEASAQLVVQDIPDPPEKVFVKCRDRDRTAEVTWQPGKENYAPILNFIIQYNTSFAPDTWITIAGDLKPSDSIRDVVLSPYGNYTFRLLARNKIGLSPPSDYTRNVCRTDADLPEKNPENVMGEGDRPNNLVIYWTPMPKIEQNGPGFTYIVSWQRADRDDDEEIYTERINKPEQYHHVVAEKQDTYKPFKITVRAGNSVGEALATLDEVIGYSGEDEPLNAPTGLMEDTETITGATAIISWDQVDTSPEAVRGFFRGFRVQFWRTKDGPESMREEDLILNAPKQYPRPREKREAVDNDLVFQLHHLPPYSDITVQVRILNKYYAGPASQAIYFTTKESEPGPPADFEVVGRGSTHFEMQWTLPNEPNGVLRGYHISYQIITGLNLGRLQYLPMVTNRDKLRTRLTGLKPDTDYRVYLAAATDKGKGEDIFLDVRTTLSGTPSAPTFQILDVDETWANVSWEPSRGANPGSVFYVQFRPRGAYHWLHSPDEESRFFILMDFLDPGTTYQVRVVSKNGAGQEAAAEWQEFMTGGIGHGTRDLKKAGWIYGIFVALLLIIIFLILFIFLKKMRDEWWEKKEAEIEEHTRQVLAEEAAIQMGILNEYHKSGSREMMDTSHASLSGSDYKEPIDEGSEFEDDEEEVPHGKVGFEPMAPPHGGHDRYGPPQYGNVPVGYAPQYEQERMQAVRGPTPEGGPYVQGGRGPTPEGGPYVQGGRGPMPEGGPYMQQGGRGPTPEGGPYVQGGEYHLEEPRKKEDSAMSSFV